MTLPQPVSLPKDEKSETSPSTINFSNKHQSDKPISSLISHNSDALVGLHTNASGPFNVDSPESVMAHCSRAMMDYKTDIESHETDSEQEEKTVDSADMSDCAARRNNRRLSEELNDALLGKQDSLIIGEEEIDGAKFYAIAGTSSLIAEEKLQPNSILAWNEKLKALPDGNGKDAKQDPAGKKATKRKRGPDLTLRLHSRCRKRVRNDDGEDEQDLKAPPALVGQDIFVVEQLVLHRELKG